MPASRPATARPTSGPTTGSSGSVAPQLALTAAAIAVVVALVLWLPLGWPALVVGLVVGALVTWLLASRAEAAVLGLAGGRPVDDDVEARLVNVVEGLALTAGTPVPEIRIRDDRTLNAMVAGRAGSGAIVVTRGLLDALDRIELEGVVAHLLARLGSPEQAAATVSVTTVGLPGFLRERLGGARGPGRGDPSVEDLVALDARGVGLTRYPPGLLGALERAAEVGTEVSDVGPATARFWFAPTNGDPAGLEVRAAALRER